MTGASGMQKEGSDSLFPGGDLDIQTSSQSPELVLEALWRGERRETSFFVLLHTCYSYSFHLYFAWFFEAGDPPYILNIIAAMVQMQFLAVFNAK